MKLTTPNIPNIPNIPGIPRIVRISLALFIGIILTAGCALSASRTTAAMHAQQHRATLAEHRQQQIARVHEYAEKGVFPINPTPSPAPVHMFKDAVGTRCAVANLIYLDGHRDLVDQTALTHNDAVVADETSGPLHEWVLTSGLTNEEVRRIQGIGFDFVGDNNNNMGGIAFIDRSAAERERLQTQLRAVEQELRSSTDASLDIATRRLDDKSRRTLVAMR